MKKIYNILSVVTVVALLASCSSAPKDKKTRLDELKKQQTQLSQEIRQLESELAKENPEAVSSVKMKEVVTAPVAARPFDHFVQTQGSVEAVDNIQVSARSAGIIAQVFVKEGDYVKAGQTLAQIDNSMTVRSIEEVKSQLELAKTVFERQKNLWDQKIGTEVQYLQAKTNKESLEKRLATLNEQLDMSRVKSPINGSVDEVNLKIGQNAAPGLPAFRVVSSDRLKMKANISESYVREIHTGNKVAIYFSDIHKELEAKITFVGRTINPLTRTFAVEVALPTSEEFRPNMTGVIRVVFHSEPSAIVVPVNVVQDVNGQKIVYIAEKDGNQMVARKKVVTVEGVYDNLAQVDGLKAGDLLVTVGYQGLNDGELIKN